MNAERRTKTAGSSSSSCILRSSFCVPSRHRCRRGYTLVELFLTIAVLAIIFGLMVDLANRVRRTSADKLTRQLLQQLNALMDNYLEHSGGQVPPVTPFLETMP